MVSDDVEYQRLCFKVKDTGIGIPNDQLDLLFQPYTQVHSKIAGEHFGGTGLGLSIYQQIVELMNGRIWLEESTDLGSTFITHEGCR